MNPATPPSALLFTAPGCPHCPGVKMALERLLQEGLLAKLVVQDISGAAEQAKELGVRSVPWLQLGDFVLTGAQTPGELRQWAERAAAPEGMSGYLRHLLANGELDEAQALLARQPEHLLALLPLMEEDERPIQVGLGIAAILEALQGSRDLLGLLPGLIALSRHDDHRIRSDACHYLGLIDDPAATEALQARLDDPHPDVREIAAESLG